ncbi:MAG: DEAD/DEAH box helicase [Verrucomicrobia bacterium]|nr:DEAD/DEAH box helicase [Verrucomicrobiota bacterium]
MVNLIIPDKWQQDALNLLRDGKDVVVQAPTGAGKTYIFELMYESLRGQTVYTVPTRALANDKLAEWRARGWDVGISTGDLAENLGARVVVATLETQKGCFLRQGGPRLLVVDEYQLLADPIRGMNYELILSVAPPATQILLLSGSVANPEDVVAWLQRIGRSARLIAHQERPVPLEEVILSDIPVQAPGLIQGYWPRLISRALLADLGPLLVFAPRRNAAEELAKSLAGALIEEPMPVSQEQAAAAGEPLAKLLRQRVAYHHSGLSYAVRAGIIEPLAKRGQLRVVVATMGLAAGINFSMRSVLVIGTHYTAGNFQRHVRPDELLQMFGRAGRRGLDETGYALVTPEVPRLHEAFPLKLKRPDPIDWPSFLAVMHVAVDRGEDPFQTALKLSRRLFSARTLTLGVERFYEGGVRPCGLHVDGERARFVRRHQERMRNSRGLWQDKPALSITTLGNLWVRTERGRWRPALSVASTLAGVGLGNICRIPTEGRHFVYGREIPVAAVAKNEWRAVKWLQKMLRRRYPLCAAKRHFTQEDFEREVLPLVTAEAMGGQLWDLVYRGELAVARFRFDGLSARGHLDEFGRWLADPETQRDYPQVCRGCVFRPECEGIELSVTPALAWRQLGLIDESGNPTRRGVLFSFFNQGEGLAIAAALENLDYPVEDLVFDLGNLRAGHRFSLDESRFGGRLGLICQQTYHRADFAGYLEMGVPPAYGAGADEVLREVVENQTPRHKLVNEVLRYGDIERAITEWRSLLRQIVQAPDYDWDRWRALKQMSEQFVDSIRSAALQPLPILLPAQLQKYQPRASVVHWR